MDIWLVVNSNNRNHTVIWSSRKKGKFSTKLMKRSCCNYFPLKSVFHFIKINSRSWSRDVTSLRPGPQPQDRVEVASFRQRESTQARSSACIETSLACWFGLEGVAEVNMMSTHSLRQCMLGWSSGSGFELCRLCSNFNLIKSTVY